VVRRQPTAGEKEEKKKDIREVLGTVGTSNLKENSEREKERETDKRFSIHFFLLLLLFLFIFFVRASYHVNAGDGDGQGVAAAAFQAQAQCGPLAHVGEVQAAALGNVALAAHVVVDPCSSKKKTRDERSEKREHTCRSA